MDRMMSSSSGAVGVVCCGRICRHETAALEYFSAMIDTYLSVVVSLPDVFEHVRQALLIQVH